MFLTKTFPNFFSVSTGLYEESHGIIDNYFEDSETNKTFNVYSKETHTDRYWFKEGEPIWVTASKQDKTVGSCQWPATDSFSEDILSDFMAYDPTFNFTQRLDLSYDWLFKKDLDLVMTYYHNPDVSSTFTYSLANHKPIEINSISLKFNT